MAVTVSTMIGMKKVTVRRATITVLIVRIAVPVILHIVRSIDSTKGFLHSCSGERWKYTGRWVMVRYQPSSSHELS